MRISELKLNENNPRFIKDDRFEKLKKSIESFPKMMELRPIIIDENYIILGGNMRYMALKELKYNEIPANWVKHANELTEDEKKQFIIKDNVGFGDWDFDILANEWDENELTEWGLDVPVFESDDIDYSDKNKEIDTNDFSDKITLKFELSSNEYQFVQLELSKLDANKETALLKLLKYE